MKILITGGRGMVGRNLLERVDTNRYAVLAPTSAELDLRDRVAVARYMRDHRPEMVIHAAGRVGGIQANMRNPVAFLVDNLDMGRNVVLAARDVGVPRLLNLGSSCMYPRGYDGALHEDMILTGTLEPTNEGYALAKIVTARLCDYIVREDPTFQYKTLVPCNLYGRHDAFDPSRSHLIPAIVHKVHQAMVGGRDVVEIWGSGRARREFMYAGDLADMIVRTFDHFDTLPAVMNVGLGHDHTIDEFYAAAAAVMGYTGGFIHDLTRPEGMARKLVSIERQTQWGWRPAHSLGDGLAKTYAFYLESGFA